MLGNIEADNPNGILKNVTIAVLLKYLRNFWRSLEISLINWKVIFLAKDLKDEFIGMNIKQKVRIKIKEVNLDISPSQILLESIDYLF